MEMAVYLSDGTGVIKLREHNFDVESLGRDGAEVWQCDGVVVAFSGNTDMAVKGLRRIVERLRPPPDRFQI
jgi:hypothetical protein